ncbi:MAG: TIR domain-containing protein, partial [Thiohalocapsa sp.]
MGEETEYDVFLSYKTQDRDAVEHIARRLSDESGLRPFFDLWCLGAGEEWQPGLERALNASRAIAVFLSAGGTGPWQTPEQQLALKKATEAPDKYIVIPVLLRGADPARITDTFLGLRGWVDFRGSIDDDKALERLVAGIKGTASVPPIRTLPDEPVPYRGLRRFEQDSADYFFGRDQDIKKLVEHVHRHPFTAVIGASGSGKSSLVRAGLLPRLAQEASTSSEAWRLVVCQPGSQPFRELAAQLADRLPAAERLTAKTQYEQALRAGPAGLADVLRSWSGGHRVLLVVDQFEELFTQTKDKAEAEGLIEGIMALAAASVSSLRVVITLRADFLGSCLDIAGLPELLESRQILLGELGPDALRAAIEEPAKKVGASFEPELVEHILSDVADERGILPMLQEALLQLWKERRGPWLTWDAYKKHEGVAGAVQAHADHVYDNLTPQQQEIARDIFLRLTTLGEGVADTRRRVDRAELALHGVPAAAVDETLAALSHRDARLITADTGKDETQTYEVTHETLIKQWPKLRNWLRDNRDALRLHHQLAERARAYAKAKERRETSAGEAAAQGEQEDPTGHLLRKGLLEEAERLAHDPAVRLSEQEQAFLDASIQERERAEAREERQRQRLRRRATLATILAVLAVGIGGAAVYLAHSEAVAKQRAVRAEADAERRALEANLNLAQAHEAEVQGRLNEPAAERSTGDYQQALLQALAAQQLPIGGRESLSFETRDALSAAALQRGFAGRWVSPALTLGSEVDAVAFNPSEPLLASASRDQAIRLWQAS